MSFRTSAQRNEFLGSLSNERGVFFAGAQFNTGGGNVTIIGGRGEESPLLQRARFTGGAESDSGGACHIRDCQGLCVLSLGELARALLARESNGRLKLSNVGRQY
jgi:hypothetical protein